MPGPTASVGTSFSRCRIPVTPRNSTYEIENISLVEFVDNDKTVVDVINKFQSRVATLGTLK